jgi:hypothetical protein
MITIGQLLYHWPLRFGARPSKWVVRGYSEACGVYDLKSLNVVRGKYAYKSITRAVLASKLETGKLEYYF